MLQLSRRAAPLAVVEPAKPGPLSVVAAGSQLALPSGQLTGQLRPLSIDGRRRIAVYELLIANETGGPVASFAYAVEPPRAGGTISWNTITVPPRTTVAIPVEIPFARRGRPQRVIAELHAAGAHLTLDAGPPRSYGHGAARRAGLGIAGVLLAGLGLAGYAFERPQVAALGAPARVRAGQSFQVAYALGPNVERASYALETSDGRRLGQGTLDPRGGVFTVNLPSGSGGGYDVRVIAGNRLGVSQRSTHVLALTPAIAPLPAAGKGAVMLAEDTVAGGDPIVVRYPAGITKGDVKLLDQDGTERASALIGKRGSSILIAPRVEVAQDFRVVVDARRGFIVSETLLPVRITPGSDPASALPSGPKLAASKQAPSAPHGAPAAPAGSPIALSKTLFRNGEPIVVSVARHLPQLQVVLMSDRGEELQRVDVDPSEKQLVLAPPALTEAAHYLVVASYARGAGQESVISSIFIRGK